MKVELEHESDRTSVAWQREWNASAAFGESFWGCRLGLTYREAQRRVQPQKRSKEQGQQEREKRFGCCKQQFLCSSTRSVLLHPMIVVELMLGTTGGMGRWH